MAQAAKLTAITECNEILKEIRRISAGISLDAINAILLSRRADNGRRNGFTVVASEMRQFANRLDEVTTLLLSEIHLVVFRISGQSKQQRMNSYYRRLSQLNAGNTAKSLAEMVLANSGQREYEQNTEIAHLLRNISQFTMAARRLCENSAALYRNARVEVAYLPAYRQELTLVADRIEQAITNASRLWVRLLDILYQMEQN